MRTMFLGCPIDILTMDETVDLARGSMRSGKGCSMWPLTLPSWSTARDRVLAADVASSDVVSIDGMGIVWRRGCSACR